MVKKNKLLLIFITNLLSLNTKHITIIKIIKLNILLIQFGLIKKK